MSGVASTPKSSEYIRWFKDITHQDLPLVGGKNASLGEMYRELTAEGVPIPNGFALTTKVYRDLVGDGLLKAALDAALEDVDVMDVESLARCGLACRSLIYEAPFPETIADEIIGAHRELQAEYGSDVRLAVRSSATAEDLPEASFAGQHETYSECGGGEAL